MWGAVWMGSNKGGGLMNSKIVYAKESYTYEEVKMAYDSAYGNIIGVHLIQGVLLKMDLFELPEIKRTDLSDSERECIEWGLINEGCNIQTSGPMPIPKPEDGVDYYLDELQSHTVTITVTVGGLKEQDSNEDMCSKAIKGLRDGSLGGYPTLVWSKRVRDVELDFKTDLPFDRKAWNKTKLMELGLNEKGNPLRPGEKARPECETTLADYYPKQSMIARIIDRISEWNKRCRQAFTEAF